MKDISAFGVTSNSVLVTHLLVFVLKLPEVEENMADTNMFATPSTIYFYAPGAVRVNEEIETIPAATIEVVFRFKSAPDVPQVP